MNNCNIRKRTSEVSFELRPALIVVTRMMSVTSRMLRGVSCACISGLLACSGVGCANWNYTRIPPGEVGGRVTIEWVGPDQFIYRPDAKRPFYFKRSNGEVIQPRSIYTDGGSIPRSLWAFRGYSPWAFGSAYIAHDWLFSAHHCDYPEAKNHTVYTSADVLSECIKTLMEDDEKRALKNHQKGSSLKSPGLLFTIDRAVRSAIARNLWDQGTCQNPPEELPQARFFKAPLRFSETIRRSDNPRIQTYDFDANRP
jgi:hypothetical protein